MTKSCVSFVRLLQSVVSVLAMMSLCGMFKPLLMADQHFPSLETSYAVNASVLLTCCAAIYSGVMCVLVSRSVAKMSASSQMTSDIALAIMLLVLALVLTDSDELQHCHDTINVRCDRFVSAVAFMLVATLLYALSTGLALLDLTDDLPSVPVTPLKDVRIQLNTTAVV
ncbi:hypothetical protein H257_14056 [Aphanomyces astaci]|uniref:MARVEL domain-containing protein n=1 Tax=Aphanomyces astaci TaxID=112090 RepID=W4FSC3_APHAT|nr:hypothetical protein H257_14056 [Aphanomyces astaci]ETV70372.1 hypothetical protein H257_14056 [Aphanomyces astaci]RQM18938.1 hypothetical protein B5M09_006371 [Aphanomyces astaci]|eukprot:XP_009840084.1 hypothetical protein H257_14056 [Aphanomyces astaci]